MKKVLWIFAALLGLSFVACTESTEEDEFAAGQWKERNVAYIDSIATVARLNQGTEVGQWRVIQSFRLSPSFASMNNNDFVYAKILKKGEGTESPVYTDSVDVNYRGRLIPTKSYSTGYVFDQNYFGNLVSEKQDGTIEVDEENLRIMVPARFEVRGLVDGWVSVLQKMHAGDIWRLYIPQELAYGDQSQTGIPAYSALVFDLYLREIKKLE